MTIPTTNSEILRAMLDNGKKDEALRWLESVAQHLSADELVPLQQMALNAHSSRKRGGAGHVRDEFAELVREFAFANAVQRLVDASVPVEAAAAKVANEGVRDPNNPGQRTYKGEDAVRRYYYKWKKTVKLNESPFA